MRTYAFIFLPVPFVMSLPPIPRSAPGGGQRLGQRRAEPRAPLDEPRALEIHPRAPVLGVVRGVEPRGELRAAAPDGQRERLARALVAEPRDDQVESLVVGVREVREPRLVAGQLDAPPGERRA